jgi:hypothetical protein
MFKFFGDKSPRRQHPGGAPGPNVYAEIKPAEVDRFIEMMAAFDPKPLPDNASAMLGEKYRDREQTELRGPFSSLYL